MKPKQLLKQLERYANDPESTPEMREFFRAKLDGAQEMYGLMVRKYTTYIERNREKIRKYNTEYQRERRRRLKEEKLTE